MLERRVITFSSFARPLSQTAGHHFMLNILPGTSCDTISPFPRGHIFLLTRADLLVLQPSSPFARAHRSPISPGSLSIPAGVRCCGDCHCANLVKTYKTLDAWLGTFVPSLTNFAFNLQKCLALLLPHIYILIATYILWSTFCVL